jgi:hypothetical protein
MTYEPGFCVPSNFSQKPSTSVGTSERFRNTSESFKDEPWWVSDHPEQRHQGWEENTKFYELQSQQPDSYFRLQPPKLKREEEARLAQLNIPMSFMDFYPDGMYTRKYGYGAYIPSAFDLSSTPNGKDRFTNGQSPWYASSDPWYATNYADNIDYGTYDSKRYQPIYRAEAEARTQELAAMYNNGYIALDNPRQLPPGYVPKPTERFENKPVSVAPSWCKGACQERYLRSLARKKATIAAKEKMKNKKPTKPRKTLREMLMAGSPYTVEDKKKRTLDF